MKNNGIAEYFEEAELHEENMTVIFAEKFMLLLTNPVK